MRIASRPPDFKTRWGEILEGISEEHVEYMLQRVPLGRMGTADEVANLVAFLASEELSFSTGATFDISGGRATF